MLYFDTIPVQDTKCPFECFVLFVFYMAVPIAVFNINRKVADGCDAREIIVSFFIAPFWSAFLLYNALFCDFIYSVTRRY
jgi:hypothetical protein